MYQYKMLQVPPTIEVLAKQQRGNEAAVYLETIVNKHAQDGWEFYRVDEIGVKTKPGCLSALFGDKGEFSTYHVITLRKATA